jgi:hypothetical protein
LRARYFLHAEEPLRVPPVASDLIWYWLPSGSPWHACTEFDEEHDAFSVGLNVDLRRSWGFLVTSLLHELTHMRVYSVAPGQVCGHGRGRPIRSRIWRAETARLACLGAPIL